MVTREIPTDESEKNLSPKEIDELYKNEFFIEENIKDFLPDNAKFISFKPMKIANCPGSLLVFDMIQERLGNQIKSRGYQFIFKNKSYLHVLHCSIISTDVNEDLNLKEKIFFPLYESIANSIIITNKNEDIIYLKGDEYQKLIEVEINNKNYDFILDTGATQSLINKSLINELISKKLITKDNYLSKGIAVLANGDSVEIEIWKIPTLKIGNKTINNLYFSVINDNNFIPLLGMDILQRLDIWKIDLNNDKIYLKN
jgi:predicted aspartyl protease